MISRKISSLMLATTTVAVFAGAALLPAISSAMMSCTFTRSLTVGSRGADVTCLQETLVAGGFLSVTPTGYFGAMTKAGVKAWQASAGVTPASGMFGPISRAKYAMMMGGTTGTTTGGTVVAPMSGVAVSLSANQPMGSAIAGAGQLDVAKFTFTASNMAGATISSLKFIRTGVVSDSNISNLYLADESGVIFGQYSSLNNGVAMFDGVSLQVNAGQSRVVTLRMDLSSSASAGNTLGWQLAMAKASDGSVVNGTPVNGPSLVVTTVSNPSLATATYTYVTTGSTVDAGTNGFRAHSATLNVTNSAVLLKSIKYTVVGSADMVNLKNATLKISGTTVAMTPIAQSNGVVVFIPTSDVRLPTGNSNVEVYVDVAGSPNRTMAWNVLRPYDMVLVDTQYNTPVTPTTSGSATTVTINQGRVTISKSTDTPTANIPLGASSVTLAKFNFYAGGEPVKLRFLPITITRTASTSAASTVDIRNISVIDDVGNSVGTTVSSGDTWTAGVATSSIAVNFGTSSSYINYIIPANTTRVLSVKVDVQSAATASTLVVALADPSAANLEGQISFQTTTSGTATGNTLTIASSPLTAALNPSFAAPTYVAGANNQRLASFVFTASSAEGAKISSLGFAKTVNASFDIQNLRVMVGGTQFGTATSIVADTETALSYSGSSPLYVPAGGSITVDLYGDILTSTTAATHSTVFDLSTTSAVGASSNSSITVKAGGVAITTTNVQGQNIVISSGSTLTLSTDSNNVSAKQVVMGSTGNELYRLKLAANNTEDVRVTDITFRDTIGSNLIGISSFNNLQLFDDAGVLLAGPINMTIASATTGDIVFSLGSTSSLIVTKNSSKTITLKGDVATFVSGGASSSSSHVFGIAAISSVTAYGKDSSASATISGTTSATTAAQEVYRSKPTLTSSVLGATTGRTRVAVDDIATLNWAANAADDLTITSVTIKFSGQAASTASAFNVTLVDANTNATWGSATTTSCSPTGNSCSVSFGPAFSISRGTTKAVKLRVVSSNFFNGSNTSDSMSAIVNAASDIYWSDGTSTAISWEAVQIPITLVNLSYE